MAIPDYIEGQPVRFTGRFYDDPEMTAPVDPATVILWLVPPTGVPRDYKLADADLDHDEVGVFSYTEVMDHPGDWKWRWEGTQPEVAMQGVITVREKYAGDS